MILLCIQKGNEKIHQRKTMFIMWLGFPIELTLKKKKTAWTNCFGTIIHWIMVYKYNQILIPWVSLVILLVKSLPAMQETLVQFWTCECYSRWEKVIKINKRDREIICACMLSCFSRLRFFVTLRTIAS